MDEKKSLGGPDSHFLLPEARTSPVNADAPEISRRILAEVQSSVQTEVLKNAGETMYEEPKEEPHDEPQEKKADLRKPERVAEPFHQETVAQQEAKEALTEIERLAGKLRAENKELRMSDPKDHFPLWGNYRSHKTANREAAIIDDMNAELIKLQTTAQHLNVEFGPLVEAMGYLSKPEGWTKTLGTIFPSIRVWHRSWTVSRIEDVEEAAANLRRSLRGTLPSRN